MDWILNDSFQISLSSLATKSNKKQIFSDDNNQMWNTLICHNLQAQTIHLYKDSKNNGMHMMSMKSV